MKSKFLALVLLLGGNWYVQAGDEVGPAAGSVNDRSEDDDFEEALKKAFEAGKRVPVCVVQDEDARDEHVYAIEEENRLTEEQIAIVNKAAKKTVKELKNTCMQCGYVASYPSKLERHMRIHTQERPFACQWQNCGLTFSQPASLKIHERMHTGEKPYVCQQCGAAFAQSNGLKVHSYMHTGERRFACSECGKKFSDQSHKIRHMRIHSQEYIECNYCKASFTDSSSRNRHEKICKQRPCTAGQ